MIKFVVIRLEGDERDVKHALQHFAEDIHIQKIVRNCVIKAKVFSEVVEEYFEEDEKFGGEDSENYTIKEAKDESKN